MAWDEEMPEILRVMVQDLGTPAKYAEDSLLRTLVVSAQLVGRELEFPLKYLADVVNVEIEPDPTDRDAGTRDDNFVNLVCLKSAAIIDQGVVRLESGIVIRDNGSMVDLREKLRAAIQLVKLGWAKEYERQKFAYQAGLTTDAAVGEAVIGPFRAIAGELYGRLPGERSGY